MLFYDNQDMSFKEIQHGRVYPLLRTFFFWFDMIKYNMYVHVYMHDYIQLSYYDSDYFAELFELICFNYYHSDYFAELFELICFHN